MIQELITCLVYQRNIQNETRSKDRLSIAFRASMPTVIGRSGSRTLRLLTFGESAIVPTRDRMRVNSMRKRVDNFMNQTVGAYSKIQFDSQLFHLVENPLIEVGIK